MNNLLKTVITLSVVAFVCIILCFGTYMKAISYLPTSESNVVVTKKSKQQCILDANNEYSRKIGLFGTPVVVNGESYDSLSSEQWQSLNNDRLQKIKSC